jgi:chemotaxis regulatin CheY-phosphate phosphatase CheZ
MNIMDIMQYQDIHRQKIERVINVMRALSTYMNHLFSGKIDDAKRVSSAVHIHGDTSTEDIVSSDDIEALLASFGQK